MKRIIRLIFVLAFCLALAVPTFANECPDVYISQDGGQTWTQCEFDGGVITPDGTTWCFYTCPIYIV